MPNFVLDEPINKRCNVFTNILQPLSSKNDSKHSKSSKSPDKLEKTELDKEKIDFDDGTVQAEVHYRYESGKFY